jgi:phospholipid/cholesterol/gamma-HCH transport system permease protein
LASQPFLVRTINGERLELAAIGSWTAANAETLAQLTEAIAGESSGLRSVTIDLAQVGALDTFGAWLIERFIRACNSQGQEALLVGTPEHYRGLLDEVHSVNRQAPPSRPKERRMLAWLETLGRAGEGLAYDLAVFLDMLGALGAALAGTLSRPRRFRLTSAVHHLDRVGLQAVPIILLITFLIGAIIAQQGLFHFRKFGAEDYVVDLVGILILREIGVLIVAIMVAGRSGSSYTAELGAMKMREEIDALRTMGRDPVEVLILPRILALVCALPVLTFLGSLAALYGGGVVAWLYGGMSPASYIARLKEAISVTHFEVGMIKAPFMALVIGLVACSEGLRVKGSAESLGLQTTTSVVKSIFLVIVLDGLFAIFFASIGM